MHETHAHRHRVQVALRGREPDLVPVFDISEPGFEIKSWEHAPQPLPGSSVGLLSADLTARYPVQILERDGDDVVQTTPNGGVVRLSASGVNPPQILDCPLKTRSDWRLLARRLHTVPDRVNPGAFEAAYDAARSSGLYLAFSALAGFAACAALTGTRKLVDLVSEDSGLVREVAETLADLLIGTVDLHRKQGFEIDAVVLFDELAGGRGLLFPLERFREVFAPAYRRLSDFFHGCGMLVIGYSSGDLRLLVPDLLDAGLDCLGPIEVAAGMSLPILKLNYGADLAFLGGIDRRALRHPDPAVLEREIGVKLSAAMVNGRYVAGFDGPLPRDLSAEQYASAFRLLQKYGRY
jgi:uroporphyrinogen decarboxylase